MTGPCQNPSCKSFGKAHPNCRCSAAMAEGGEASDFCSVDRAHGALCDYYQNPKPDNPEEGVAAYLANQGFHKMLAMKDKPEMALYEFAMRNGHKDIQKHIRGAFRGEDYPKARDTQKARDAIHEWMQKGGIAADMQDEIYKHHAPQNFAEGGMAENHEGKGVTGHHPIENEKPVHNMVMQAAKARISNYLNSLRPQEIVPKLPFDRKPDQSDQKKEYHRALHMAAHPLSIMDKIKHGNLHAQDILHFKSMHPELDTLLQKRLTEQMMQDQLDGKKPKASVRQGLSTFMGTPLSSDSSPEIIQAAQAVFDMQAGQPATPQGAPQKKSKGKPSALSKSDQAFLTGPQAIAERKQKV